MLKTEQRNNPILVELTSKGKSGCAMNKQGTECLVSWRPVLRRKIEQVRGSCVKVEGCLIS
jgi:hypothetical protein